LPVIRAIHAGFDAAKAVFSCVCKKKFDAGFRRSSRFAEAHPRWKKSMEARAKNSVTEK